MSITSFVGPFPTDFAVPSDCSAISSNSIAGFDFKSSCLPDDFNPDTTAYYSPGTACPSGYTAQEDCTRTNGPSTTVTCCPVRGDIELWCVSEPGSLEGPWVSMQCTWSAGDAETVLLVTSDSSTMGVTMSGGAGINAYGLRMVYESSDLETSTSTPSETARPTTAADATTLPSQTATEDAIASSSASANSTSGDSSGGLSTGAIAAIAVVIPAVLIALGLCLFFFIRRRKQQSSTVNAAIANHESKYPEGQPVSSSESGFASYNSPPAQPHPLQQNNPRSGELYGDNAHSPYQGRNPWAQELPADSYVAELPADPPPPSKSPSFNVAVNITPSPMSEGGQNQGYFQPKQ